MPWRVRWTFVSWGNSFVGTQSCPTSPGRSAGRSDSTRQWYVRVLDSTDALKPKRHGSTASSKCEAEMISLASALKSEVLPMLELIEQALCRLVRLRCLENNIDFFQTA